MAIKITNAIDEFDHVFLREMLITQSRMVAVDDPVIYTVSLAWSYYKIDPVTGVLTFKDGTNSAYSPDFRLDAMDEYAEGDSVKLTALVSNQAAVAAIVHDETGFILEEY